MKSTTFGFLFVLILFIGTAAFMYLGISSNNHASNMDPADMVSKGSSSSTTLTVKNRKLKNNIDPDHGLNQDDKGHVSLDDYRPIDPSPNSKASIRPGPIQHGTPLMPYIPKPSPPPSQPNHE